MRTMIDRLTSGGSAVPATLVGTGKNQKAAVHQTGQGCSEQHRQDQWQREVDRCREEIASIEALLRAGHPDVEGLVLALADWSEELRMIAREKKEAAA